MVRNELLLPCSFHTIGLSIFLRPGRSEAHKLTGCLGRALDLDINLGGAPNFRAPKGPGGSLNVFGVAQPRIAGIKAILSLLNCQPGTDKPESPIDSTRSPTRSGFPYIADASVIGEHPRKCLWFNTREEPVGE